MTTLNDKSCCCISYERGVTPCLCQCHSILKNEGMRNDECGWVKIKEKYSQSGWFDNVYDIKELDADIETLLTKERAQAEERVRQHCEHMLNIEAERVAYSILQLIHSTEFKKTELDPAISDEFIATANLLLNAAKERWDSEIRATLSTEAKKETT